MLKREYHAVYSEEANMTFIIEDAFYEEDGVIDELVSTSVTGFYFGEPNDEDTEFYKHKSTMRAW